MERRIRLLAQQDPWVVDGDMAIGWDAAIVENLPGAPHSQAKASVEAVIDSLVLLPEFGGRCWSGFFGMYAGQRTRPRGFRATGGSSGADRGDPS